MNIAIILQRLLDKFRSKEQKNYKYVSCEDCSRRVSISKSWKVLYKDNTRLQSSKSTVRYYCLLHKKPYDMHIHTSIDGAYSALDTASYFLKDKELKRLRHGYWRSSKYQYS